MNLAQLIDHHVASRVALVGDGRSITWGELRERVAHVRSGLAALGLARGERVALACDGPEFVVAYLAVLGIGGVAVPLNPASPAPELTREIATVGARAVFVEGAHAGGWRGVARADVPSVEHVIDVGGPGVGTTTMTALLEDGAAAASAGGVVDVGDDDLAVLMFTSGTAGAPRAAMLTHGNLLANLHQGTSAHARIERDDVVYGVLPLFHIFGLNVVLGVSLLRGATLVLERGFDPAGALDAIRTHRVTVLPGAPPMWVAFAELDGAPADALASVRLALTGAAPMPLETWARIRDRFGVEVAEGYGLTEASPIVTSSAGLPIRAGSVGKVLTGIEVRLVDDSGEDVLEGDAGEVWVRGPNVFRGYLDDPTHTARVLTPAGWLRTGDIAETDDDGYLYLVDRAKDLILVSGFNVYPAEVEQALGEHPGVAEVGVVGVPDAHTGETVRAVVVPAAGAAIDADELVQWCRARVARYKCPTQVVFTDRLPRGATGKLVRRSLI